MDIKSEVFEIIVDHLVTWGIKLTINGNETWLLDRIFQSKKQAETHAEKWAKKWSRRL